MKSKSKGKGEHRCISVSKIRKKNTDVPSLSSLTFSEGTKEVLSGLFVHYPPGDEVEDLELSGKSSNKNESAQRKRDNTFRKPLMNKEEIAKKMESLASKLKNNANLRKIFEDKSKLPIMSYKDVITSTVESHQVILISGETGCGKTTQVTISLLCLLYGIFITMCLEPLFQRNFISYLFLTNLSVF
ncbi:hypothetical protein C1H46_045334 [Malus baccata]|uniref:RNA helicase n=1 Tax=Malus baccata TaxID=106549 RepID=A0A540K4H8_MALBA|nr:hypothetical protein C1H46_045334 [Malus baccata]